jgi:hypothetical protein
LIARARIFVQSGLQEDLVALNVLHSIEVFMTGICFVLSLWCLLASLICFNLPMPDSEKRDSVIPRGNFTLPVRVVSVFQKWRRCRAGRKFLYISFGFLALTAILALGLT